ncbi:hypothetical protein GCM10010123_11680 [Pilimelia anulata]|uniref:Uncharacterized protein n=1 Tax=Pilimelia anulata TaxID=53371 RepID=A0A8J3B0I3_9ACTN|nr:hypothetical protein [Pilimelia anulata]GGJ83645.1 hypothetical protein GCM10010123_11680 [Pilimelia anulata]
MTAPEPDPARDVLSRLVAGGRAAPPAAAGPVPLPPRWGDPDVDAAVPAELRDGEQR